MTLSPAAFEAKLRNADIARCQREAAEAAETYRRTGDRGAYLGAMDWAAEEIEILRAIGSDGEQANDA